MIATNKADIMNPSRAIFSGATREFYRSVVPYANEAAFNGIIGDRYGTGAYGVFTQTTEKHLDGSYSTSMNLKSYIIAMQGIVNGNDLNLCSTISTSVILEASAKGNDFISIDAFSDSRYPYTPQGEFPTGSGGPAGPTPLPFLIGATWDPYRRNTDGIVIPSLDYMEAKRIPKIGDFSEHGIADRTATVRIVDINGTCWYATSNYIITSIQKQEQVKFNKVETSEGDYMTTHGIDPRFFRITGSLLSMDDFNYARDWQWNWNKYFRGDITNANNARFFLLYGGWLLGGHLVNFQTVEQSGSPFSDQFAFDIYVTNYTPLPKMSIPKNASTETLQIEKGSTVQPVIRKEGSWYKYYGLTLDEAKARETSDAVNNEEEV